MDAIAFGSIFQKGNKHMEYRIVRSTDAGLEVVTFTASTPADAVLEAAKHGYAFRGFNANPAQREQLQGQPKFTGLLGPMWDGDAIRYEDQAAYDELSA